MKITNQELEKFSKEYTIEELTEKGTKKIEEQIETEIDEKQNILGKNAEITETEEYLEISVTYEVIENIGMQEKIDEQQEKPKKRCRPETQIRSSYTSLCGPIDIGRERTL